MSSVAIKLRPKNILRICKRFHPISTNKLVFSEYGDPLKVLYQQNENIADPKDNEVLIKMLAAPVNPVDINIIQGKYPGKLSFPAIPGTEGVAKVVKTGSQVINISEEDHVIPVDGTLGLWRTYLCVPQEQLLKVPKSLGLLEAATLAVNPCTAYRMLKDFVSLKVGDTVVQNGANSACGQSIIQICHAWGINTVNIVRNRPELEQLKAFLKSLGATYILTEEELRSTDIFKTKKVPKPKLALDCVGGNSSLEILRQLQNGHPMVTYGGMSRKPVQVPTSALIFKDLHISGFRIAGWTDRNKRNSEWLKMFDDIISMISKGDLKGPSHQMVKFEDYKEALMNTLTAQGMTGKKYVLSFDN